MQIKLLALDIDGTLLNSQHQLSQRNAEAVQRAADAGVKIALVTGRRFHAARPYIAELGLQLPIITHNGALTKNAETLEVINYYPLDRELSRELVLIGREFQADTLCCDDPQGEGLLVYDSISEDNYRLKAYINLFSDFAREVNDLHGYITAEPIQIFYCGPCDLMDRLAAKLAATYGDNVKLVMTAYRKADMTILDAINAKSSKGVALHDLAISLGIDPQEIMAMGDNHNDLEMLDYAGIPVMMANSEAVLHGRGYATTVSNDEDGVAVAIEKYIFQQS